MTYHSRPLATLCMGAALCAGLMTFPAAGRAEVSPDDPRLQPFLLMLHPSQTREDFVASVLRNFRMAAGERMELTPADIDAARRIALADRRADQLSEVIRADIDNDGRVSRDESEVLASRQGGRKVSPNLLGRLDRDKDGFVDLEEARRLDDESARDMGPLAMLSSLLADDDPKHGRRLTREQIQASAEKAFDLLDRDHNTVLSHDEAELIRLPREIAAMPPCVLPKPAKNERVVLFSSYEGHALSTITVAGQDQITHTATVLIEPGREPLYLVLSTYSPMIWQLTGDTARIAHVVAAGREIRPMDEPMAAVTGVERQKVSIVSATMCPGYFDPSDAQKSAKARAQIKKALGREPDMVAGIYKTTHLLLPSGAVAAELPPPPPPKNFDPGVWREMIRLHPGGLQTITPAEVISAAPAQAYDVLPGYAGLAQLTGNGTLQKTGERQYKIVRPLPRFPAELHGGHSVRFVLGKGITMPAGSPGHSCVVSEASGEALSEGRCR